MWFYSTICGKRQMRRVLPPPVWAGLHFRDGLELNLSELGRCGEIWSDMGRWQSWPCLLHCGYNASIIQYSLNHWSHIFTGLHNKVCCSYLLKFVWEALTRRRWSVMNIQMFMTQVAVSPGRGVMVSVWCVSPLIWESLWDWKLADINISEISESR